MCRSTKAFRRNELRRRLTYMHGWTGMLMAMSRAISFGCHVEAHIGNATIEGAVPTSCRPTPRKWSYSNCIKACTMHKCLALIGHPTLAERKDLTPLPVPNTFCGIKWLLSCALIRSTHQQPCNHVIRETSIDTPIDLASSEGEVPSCTIAAWPTECCGVQHEVM